MTTTFKPYPKYKPSGVEWLGDIPEHWEMTPNRAFIKPRKELVGDEHSQYTLLSLTLNGVIARDMDNPTGKFPAEFNTYQKVLTGDLVFCLFDMDETPRTVGLSPLPGMITGAYAVFEPSDKDIANYLYRFYLAMDDGKYLKPLYSGLRKTITKTRFLGVRTPLPSPEERKAIGNFLESETAKIDETIKELEKSIELLNEEKTSLINEYVTGKINPETGKPYPKYKPSGVEWLGDIPEHWTVEKITNGFRQIGSGTTPKSEKRDYYEGDIPWVTTSELRETVITSTTDSITEEALRAYPSLRKYDAGSLLIAMYGATIGRLGILGIEATCNQACCVFAGPTKLTVKYSYYWLWSQRPNLIAMASGGGQSNLSQTSLKLLRLPFPPLSDQMAISAFLDSESSKVESLISEKQSLIESLKEYRTSLIHEAVTGKIDLRKV